MANENNESGGSGAGCGLALLGIILIIAGIFFFPLIFVGIAFIIIGIFKVLTGGPSENIMTDIKVAGVTFDNPDGINRQDIFKELAKSMREEAERSELYNGLTNKDILEIGDNVSELEDLTFDATFFEYKFKGNPAVYVLWDGNILGNLPSEEVETFIQKSKQHKTIKGNGRIVGGKYKCVDIDDSGKEVVRTDTLTYGARLNIYFLD